MDKPANDDEIARVTVDGKGVARVTAPNLPRDREQVIEALAKAMDWLRGH